MTKPLPPTAAPATPASDETQVLIIQPDHRDPPARLLRWLPQLGVSTAVIRPFLGEQLPDRLQADGLVVLGGYLHAYDHATHPWLAQIQHLYRQAAATDTPVLRICLGAQLLATTFGGELTVDDPAGPEIGAVDVTWTHAGRNDPFAVGLSDTFWAGAFRSDSISKLSADAVRLGYGHAYTNQIFRRGAAIGVQFHPETTPAIFDGWCHDATRQRPQDQQHITAKAAEFARLDPGIQQDTQALINNFTATFEIAGGVDMPSPRGSARTDGHESAARTGDS